ncbi:MAG: MFS transporter [Actinomycetota bacterium]
MSGAVRAWDGSTFASLRHRNFRLFFVGQFISQSGSWMSMMAQTLLVLDLTGSGVLLGFLAACQFGPVLFLGPFAGAVADRVDKRRLLYITQSGAMLQSFALGTVVLAGWASVPALFALATVQGLLTAFDNPARRSFVVEMVPATHVANAVSLNSALMTGSRVVGPALAGALIALVGYAWCFLIDGISYLAVLGGLRLMRPADLRAATRKARGRGQVRQGFAYVRQHPDLAVPMVMMAVIGTFAFNFSVVTPLLVTKSLGGSEQAYTLLFSSMSVGAVVGALLTARRRQVPPSHVVLSAAFFGATMCLLAATPNLWLAYPAAVAVGLGSIGFMTSSTAIVQLLADPSYRGRVLSLQAMLFLGTTPIGGPLIGWVVDSFGPRIGVLVGAAACLGAAAWANSVWKRPRPVPVEPTVSPADVPGVAGPG